MRIGCCTGMAGTVDDKIGMRHFETIAAIGFDYLELPLSDVAMLGDDAFEALRRAIDASGVRCEACNNFFPSTMRLTGPDVDENRVMAYVEHALACAGQMGAKVVVFGSGTAKSAPEGFPVEAAWHQLVALTRRFGSVAEKNGVTIVIEPLRRAESNLVNTFAEGCRMAEAIGSEHVKVLVDYYHLMEENEPIDHVAQRGASYLRHAHFARQAGRAFPAAADEEAYAAFAAALTACGYGGRVSLEAKSEDCIGEAPRALSVMRTLFC